MLSLFREHILAKIFCKNLIILSRVLFNFQLRHRNISGCESLNIDIFSPYFRFAIINLFINNQMSKRLFAFSFYLSKRFFISSENVIFDILKDRWLFLCYFGFSYSNEVEFRSKFPSNTVFCEYYTLRVTREVDAVFNIQIWDTYVIMCGLLYVWII
jgi:hypothetical protein